MPEIKLAGPEDQWLFLDPLPGVFDHPVRDHLLREFLEDPRHHLAVATEDGSVVGFASAVHYLHPDKEPELWINEVGVSTSYRQRGIGKRLVRALLDLAVQLGCREAWVFTERDNAPARRLYSSLGGSIPAGSEPVMFSIPVGEDRSAGGPGAG